MKFLTCALMMGCLSGFSQQIGHDFPHWDSWDWAMFQANQASDARQAEMQAAEQARLREASKADTAAALARENKTKAETGQYNENMRLQQWYDRAFATVPGPLNLSNAYLREISGHFEIDCKTNLRAGTIEYRVTGQTNLNTVFTSLKNMPNRVRLSQGTNSVTVAIRLPTTPY